MPGNNANPGGRPKGSGDKLAAMLAAVSPEDAAVIIKVQVKKAKKGDTRAAEFVADRLFGKAPQAVNVGGSDGGPFVVHVIYGDDGTNG